MPSLTPPVRLLPAAFLLAAAPLAAQGAQSYTLRGDRLAVYNLVGAVRVEGGSGSEATVEVTRRGADASRLRVETGEVRGRQSLRVIFPDDRIVYRREGEGRWGRSRTTLRVDDDGTFGDGDGDGGRRVEIRSEGDGMEASADVRVVVPRGREIAIYVGAGEATVRNVEGNIVVDVSAASVTTNGTKGKLFLDTGSGRVEVTDAEGDVEIDSGSGGVTVTNVRGPALRLDTGSGRVRGTGIQSASVEIDSGSGSVELARVRADDLVVDSGSGSVEVGLVAQSRSVRIDSGSGSVTLTLPEAYGAEITAETGSGGVEFDMPVQMRRQSRGYFSGSIGDGRGRITIDTGSGSVRLRRG